MAFVRTYVELVNEARRTGDVSKLQAVSAEGCRSCDGVIRTIREIHDGGGRYIGDHSWRVGEFASTPKGEDPVELEVYLESKNIEVVRKAGAKPEKWPGTVAINVFKLSPKGDGWKVREFYEQG